MTAINIALRKYVYSVYSSDMISSVVSLLTSDVISQVVSLLSFYSF
jgi:hypothetical protein